MKLYGYQKNYLATLPTRAIMHADLGTGKTIMSLAHYYEHARGLPLLVVAPASKVRTGDWEREAREYFGEDNMPEMQVVSYERIARIGKKYPNWFDYSPLHGGQRYAVIADECVTGETLVNTDNGLVEIADIKKGDRVLSRNNETGFIEYKKVTRTIKRKTEEDLYLINYTGGAIISTYNHLHYVNGDYQLAQNVREGDELLYVETKSYKISNKEVRGNSVVPELQNSLVCERLDIETGTTASSEKPLYMQSKVWARDSRQSSEQESKRKIEQSNSSKKSADHTQGKRNAHTDLGKEPRYETFERWQRENIRATDIAVQRVREGSRWMGNGTTGQDDGTYREWLSDELQAGYRERYISYWYRNRWSISSEQIGKMERQQEVPEITSIRVESVEILKRGSIKRFGVVREPDYVYCLEVEDNRNFFANGVLTGNCHRLKSPSSKANRAVLEIINGGDFFVGLSGTPMPNGWMDFAGYSKLFGFTKGVTEFKNKYCNIQTYKGWPEIVGYRNVDELEQQWNSISRYLSRAQATELPDRQFITVNIDDVPKEYYRLKLERTNKQGEFIDNPSALAHAMRQATTEARMAHLDSILSDTSDNIVVFYNYVSERSRIIELLNKNHKDKKLFRMDGEKHEAPTKDEWANVKNSVTLAHYKSASTGVELQYANVTVYFSPTYSYADYAQSIGRTHRNGQEKKCVFYCFHVKGTIDYAVWQCLKGKKDFQAQLYVEEVLDNNKSI